MNNKAINNFKVLLTLKGNESRYAKSVVKKFGEIKNISFVGVVAHETLHKLYAQSDCLIFPSRLETWGLPISEFSLLNKPMLLANLPYAYNTSAGSKKVAFFDPFDGEQLATLMERIIKNDFSFLKEVPSPVIEKPATKTWEETIDFILNNGA